MTNRNNFERTWLNVTNLHLYISEELASMLNILYHVSNCAEHVSTIKKLFFVYSEFPNNISQLSYTI